MISTTTNFNPQSENQCQQSSQESQILCESHYPQSHQLEMNQFKLEEEQQTQGGSNIKQTNNQQSSASQLQLDEEQMQKLIELLDKNGLPTKNPVLRLEVVPQHSQYMVSHQRNFSLIKSDIESVFKVFGEIKDVTVESQQGFALVAFYDIVSAFFAQQSLNNYFLSKYNANLQVKWINNKSSNSPSSTYSVQDKSQSEFSGASAAVNNNNSFINQENLCQQNNASYGPQYSNNQYNATSSSQNPIQMTQFSYQNIYQTPSTSCSKSSINNVASQNPYYQAQNTQNMTSPQQQQQLQQQQQANIQSAQDENIKYTCRFDIQIENDKEFQVARRLIGAKGCNMKRIIEICCKGSNYDQYQEIVKLRLRGKGSGFKEGPKQEESNEPLHLCISSRYYDKYQIACNNVQELILNVYEEYKRFCEKNRKEPQKEIQIKKIETVTGRRAVPQTPPKIFQPTNTTSNINTQNISSQQQQQQTTSAPAFIPDPVRNLQMTSFQYMPQTAGTQYRYQNPAPYVPNQYQNSMNFNPLIQQRNSMNDKEQYNQLNSGMDPISIGQRSQSFNTQLQQQQQQQQENNFMKTDSKPYFPSLQ